MNECKDWEREIRYREEIDKLRPTQEELDQINNDMKLRNGKTYGEGGEGKPKRASKPRAKRVKPVVKPIVPIIDKDALFVPLIVTENIV